MFILLAILIFGILILIHEGGHFLVARHFGVTVNEFSIGMGPKLLSHRSKKSGITYSLRLLPFGGYVAMEGEDTESEDKNAFGNKPVLQRIAVTAAGALVNIIAGILVMTVIVISSDELYANKISYFAEIENGTTSEDMGLAVGDRIIRIGSVRVFTANDVQYEIMRQGIKPLDITVMRDGERITFEDISFPTVTEQGATFGMRDFAFSVEEKNFANTAKHAFARSYSSIKMVYDSLADLIKGRYGVESVSGPVGVTEALGEAAKEGGADFIYLAAFISINLGVMNLLPLPALDGGRLLFQIIELIRRKPVSKRIEGYVHGAGLLVLLSLIFVITVKDVIHLF